MVGLVPRVLSQGVVGKGDPQIAEVEESPDRQGAFNESDVAVDGTVDGVGPRESDGGIGFRAAEVQLVVGLLVAPGVDRGPHGEALGDDQQIPDAFPVKPERGAEPRGPRADDKGVHMTRLHSRAISMPPPMSMTVPVE